MTSKPTAQERYYSMLNGGFRLENERVDFLIKLVEAAINITWDPKNKTTEEIIDII